MRVATIAYRLATAGRGECPVQRATLGLVLRHLGQFALAERPNAAAEYQLNSGPSVSVVVPGSPAATAGVEPGDAVLRIDGAAPPRDDRLDQEFDQKRAQAFSDRLDDIAESAAADGAVVFDLLRGGRTVVARVVPVSACPSRVHLARSNQLNAFADGLHIFITTRIVSMARSDDELAFVLAHEMAHNILQHAVTMRAEGVSRGPFRTLGHGGQIIRQTEREADLLGADLMRAAGYDAVKGANFLRVVDQGQLHVSLFSGHESAPARLAAIRAHLAEALPSPASADVADPARASTH